MTADEADAMPAPSDEQVVLEFLRDTLQYPGLTLDDDFFEVGGHSLMIIQLIARLKAEHGLVISAKAFVTDPRIGAVAQTATRAS